MNDKCCLIVFTTLTVACPDMLGAVADNSSLCGAFLSSLIISSIIKIPFLNLKSVLHFMYYSLDLYCAAFFWLVLSP